MRKFVENLNTRFRWRWVALLAALLALAGCSFVRMGYENLPSLVQWELDRYLDLDAEQEAIVARHLDELHRWHRREQLPQYGEFLRAVDDRLRSPLDGAQVSAWRGRVGEAWAQLADRLAPAVAELAPTLRPEQLRRMRAHFDESNDKYRETHLAAEPQAREQARGDRVVKRAKFFLGDVSLAQGSELRARAAALPASEDAWFAERVDRQQRLIGMLERLRNERPAREPAIAIAGEVLRGLWEPREPQRRVRLEAAVAASDALTAAMVAQATPRQREYLSRLLRGYVEDAEALADRPRVAGAAARAPAGG